MFLKQKNNFSNKYNRQVYKKREIFFECCGLLDNANFSNNLWYYAFKRRHRFLYLTKIKNQCLINGYKKSIISKFKLSRHAFLYKVLNSSMVGFHRSIW